MYHHITFFDLADQMLGSYAYILYEFSKNHQILVEITHFLSLPVTGSVILFFLNILICVIKYLQKTAYQNGA